MRIPDQGIVNPRNPRSHQRYPRENQRYLRETNNMAENEISFLIRAAIFDVYNKLGAGLYESVYEKALIIELNKRGLEVQSQLGFKAVYDEIDIGEAFKLDLLVNDKVIIELKSVEHLQEVHHKQIITYLKLTGLKLGILVNFNCSDLKANIIRKVNGL